MIGDSIYIFGSEGVADEKGRVWVSDTVAKAWSHLDPAPGAPYPPHRALHAAASSELLGPGETVFKERAPQQPADPATVVPRAAGEPFVGDGVCVWVEGGGGREDAGGWVGV